MGKSIVLFVIVLFCFKGIIKAIREVKHLRTLDLSFSSQVDNSVLEAAVSVLESDERRQLSINRPNTSVNFVEFMKLYKGTRLESNSFIYKNLVVS